MKFSDFLFLLTEKLSVIAGVDYFVLQVCWRWIEKYIFFNFMDFNPRQTKIK